MTSAEGQKVPDDGHDSESEEFSIGAVTPLKQKIVYTDQILGDEDRNILNLRSNYRKCHSAYGKIESDQRANVDEGCNHVIKLDLETSARANGEITDSHTAYRKIIDREISQLKLQLSETQALADTLQNDLNQKKLSCELLQEQLNLVTTQNKDKGVQVIQLETVVHHLQEDARENGEIRAELQVNVTQLDGECHRFRHQNKRLRNEARKLKKELEKAHNELEGVAMEKQGLKSENEWLKKQLWPGNEDAIEQLASDSELDNTEHEVAITGIRNFLSPPKPKSRRRRRNTQGPLHIDGIEEETRPGEDAEDVTSGYNSIPTDTKHSATESSRPSHNVAPQKVRPPLHNSFISDLAMRHGVSQPDDVSHTHSHLTEDTPSNIRDTKRHGIKSSSHVNQRGRAYQRHSSEEVLSMISQMNLQRENANTGTKSNEDNPTTEEKESSHWNLWGMFNGTNSKGKNDHQTEEKTTELSESSHCSDDFVQFNKLHGGSRPSPSVASNEKPTKTVLVPKRLGMP